MIQSSNRTAPHWIQITRWVICFAPAAGGSSGLFFVKHTFVLCILSAHGMASQGAAGVGCKFATPIMAEHSRDVEMQRGYVFFLVIDRSTPLLPVRCFLGLIFMRIAFLSLFLFILTNRHQHRPRRARFLFHGGCLMFRPTMTRLPTQRIASRHVLCSPQT